MATMIKNCALVMVLVGQEDVIHKVVVVVVVEIITLY